MERAVQVSRLIVAFASSKLQLRVQQILGLFSSRTPSPPIERHDIMTAIKSIYQNLQIPPTPPTPRKTQ